MCLEFHKYGFSNWSDKEISVSDVSELRAISCYYFVCLRKKLIIRRRALVVRHTDGYKARFSARKVEAHPLMTEVQEPSYQTAVTSKDSSIFGIGASLVKCTSWIVLSSWKTRRFGGQETKDRMMLVLTN